MTELKLGSIHLRSYIKPVHWKVFTMKRSTKTGQWREILIGWHPNLEQALKTVLDYRLADAEIQSIHEVIELVKQFQEDVRELSR